MQYNPVAKACVKGLRTRKIKPGWVSYRASQSICALQDRVNIADVYSIG